MTRIFVAGHNGMVGSAILRRLAGEAELITADRSELDLTNQSRTQEWLSDNKPQLVIIASAKVGGIHANDTYPADFISQNLMIQSNLISGAFQSGCTRLLFLGSSCIYPKFADQPIVEESLLTGPLEATNESYAIAKIAGVKMCEAYNRQYGTDFRALMPTNLYGPGDNFHPEDSHVIPALIRKMHEAKDAGANFVDVWGTGDPRREFLFVDDLADACAHILKVSPDQWHKVNSGDGSHLNVGSGFDLTIRSLAALIAQAVGYPGELRYDKTRPDGTPRKRLDVTKMAALGWQASTQLEEGLAKTYDWFCAHDDVLRG
ncbi:MAG: GDP-L-fucose synthase [Pseudomonadales bacterium]|nr:GDP-L-fucose synthase [Pseudomonadales bacterium]MBO6595965.1 GDP-L-fucose synthase [Pseudomonadales bacterium]MBO6822448.1 GDP-L-fucose synthase [Pseudomonadales bacterium]